MGEENKVQVSTLKAILNSFNAASEDPTRIHLNCVAITRLDDKRLQLEAVDGFMLARVHVVDSEIAEKMPVDLRLVVMREQIPTLKLLMKSNKYGFEHEWSGDSLIVGTEKVNGLVVRIKSDKLNSVSFPNTQQMLPWYGEKKTAKIAFNAEFLHDLAKAMQDETRKTAHIQIEFAPEDNGLSPISVRCGDNYGVLMPVRYP